MTATAGPSHRSITVAHLVLALPWIAIVVDAFDVVADNSFLWHVRAGEAQAAAAEVLTADPFSYTMLGEPWLTQSWLVELLYAWLEESAGELAFVAPMILVTAGVTFLGIGLLAYRRSQSLIATGGVLLLSTVLMLGLIVPRPALFSYLLFVLAILAWDRPANRWAVPFVFWIWASVHGSFPIGLVYLGLIILADRDWKAIRVLLVAGAVTLATAHGFGVVRMLFDFAGSGGNLAYVSEWASPDLLEPTMLPMLAAIGFLIYGATRGRVRPADLWLIVPLLALSFSAERSVGMAWIGLVPLLACSMSIQRRLRPFPPLATAMAGLVILLLPFAIVSTTGLDEEAFPVGAEMSLIDVPTFHDDYVGGYLIWSSWPDRLVYIDDRVELYGDRIGEFVKVRSGVLDWEPIFERDSVEQALLVSGEPLARELARRGWDVVYDDLMHVVLRPAG